MRTISAQAIENKGGVKSIFHQIWQNSHSACLKCGTESSVSGRVLPVKALPRGKDFRAEGRRHGRDLRTWIAVDFHADGVRYLQHLGHQLLHRRAVEVLLMAATSV